MPRKVCLMPRRDCDKLKEFLLKIGVIKEYVVKSYDKHTALQLLTLQGSKLFNHFYESYYTFSQLIQLCIHKYFEGTKYCKLSWISHNEIQLIFFVKW